MFYNTCIHINGQFLYRMFLVLTQLKADGFLWQTCSFEHSSIATITTQTIHKHPPLSIARSFKLLSKLEQHGVDKLA